MIETYLDPSTQEANQYKGGATGYKDSEEYWCRKVCQWAENYLDATGRFTVVIGGTTSAAANAAHSNRVGVASHIGVHTNAGGGRGTECWYYTGSTEGKKLAAAVYKPIAAESDAPDRGLKHNAVFVTTRATKAPACLVEILFHDNASDAAEMRRDYRKFGRALAKGICDYHGVTFVELPTTPPVVPPTTPPVVKEWAVTEQSASRIVIEK